MHTYKSIAVGTDGSATSMVAVRAAASLARVYGAELTIICAHYTASGSMLNSTNAELSRVDIVTVLDGNTVVVKPSEFTPYSALALGVQPVGASDWLAFGGEGVGPFFQSEPVGG